jgi:hypothetical protein
VLRDCRFLVHLEKEMAEFMSSHNRAGIMLLVATAAAGYNKQ